MSANKGLVNGGGGFIGDVGVNSGNAIANTLITQTTRSWTDGNRNFVPECDLLSPLANGECGAMANANFGKLQPGTTYDASVLRGLGRPQVQLGVVGGRAARSAPRCGG